MSDDRTKPQKVGDAIGAIVFDAPAAVVGVIGRYIGGSDRKKHNVAVHNAAQAKHRVEKLERELEKAELNLRARQAAAAAWKATNRPEQVTPSTTTVDVGDVQTEAPVPARPATRSRRGQQPTPEAQ